MVPNRLVIEFDEDDDWVKLRRESSEAGDEALFQLAPGFSLDDIRTALLATGEVREHGSDLVAAQDASCRRLGKLIGEMFTYFDGPDRPSSELREIQAAVADYGLTSATCPAIPLWALAWLDLAVREDLADDARSRGGIWSNPDFVVHAEAHCRHRVGELLQRYNEPAAPIPAGRMASSDRTRRSSMPGQANTG